MQCKECNQESSNGELNPDGICWNCWKKANPNEIKEKKPTQIKTFTPGLEYSEVYEDKTEIEDVKQEMLNNPNYEDFIGFRVPIEVKEKLLEIAKKENTTLSEIVRRKIMIEFE